METLNSSSDFYCEIYYIGPSQVTNRLTVSEILDDLASKSGRRNDLKFQTTSVCSGYGMSALMLLDTIRYFEEQTGKMMLAEDSDNLHWLDDYKISYLDVAAFFAIGSSKVNQAKAAVKREKEALKLRRQTLSNFFLRKMLDMYGENIPADPKEKKKEMDAAFGCLSGMLPSKAIQIAEKFAHKPAPEQTTIWGLLNYFTPA